MSDALILSACRTPIGKFRGALGSLSVSDLGAHVVRAALVQSDVDPGDVDEVIFGNVLTAGVGQAPARQAALKAGLPPTVAALTINKVCGSGLKAAMLGAQAARCGDAGIIVAGGMESMTNSPMVRPRNASDDDSQQLDSMMHDGLTCAMTGLGMGRIAEKVADEVGVTREEQDQFALQSHQRAIAAAKAGLFDAEIVPIAAERDGQAVELSHDQGPRVDSSMESLAGLKTVFRADGSVTAGNASMISDGAAAVVIASEAATAKAGVAPLARVVCSATSGEKPDDLFIAPVAAIQMVLQKAGRTLDDVDLFEINEAFASQMLACLKHLELSADRVNVHGGAIALGHPIGASGARVLVTLLHALKARDQKTGVASLCLGGGNAVAMLVERL
jgi:acetyl-CoA C-acetyltransferase